MSFFFSVSLDLLKGFCAVVTDLLGKTKTYDCKCQATSLEFEQQQGQCTKSPISSFHVRKPGHRRYWDLQSESKIQRQ